MSPHLNHEMSLRKRTADEAHIGSNQLLKRARSGATIEKMMLLGVIPFMTITATENSLPNSRTVATIKKIVHAGLASQNQIAHECELR
jgi:hypothetical protein